MIIAGIIILIIVWLVAPVLPLPPPIWELVHVAGILLLVIGVILLLLSFFGVRVGRGIYTRGNRSFWL